MAGFYLTVAGKSSAMMAATAGNIAFHPIPGRQAPCLLFRPSDIFCLASRRFRAKSLFMTSPPGEAPFRVAFVLVTPPVAVTGRMPRVAD